MGASEPVSGQKMGGGTSGSTVKSAQAQAAAAAERRVAPRSQVIKSAKLIFDGAHVFNCLVLDESSGGVMIDLGAMIKVPEHVTIKFNSGGAYPAARCWSAGSKAGLKFIGGQIIAEQTAQRMQTIAGILKSQGISAALTTLRTVRFFDNADLRRATEDVEAAQLRLEAILDGAVYDHAAGQVTSR